MRTLPKRQISAGAAEAIKMAMTFDSELFRDFEKNGCEWAMSEDMIARAVDIKLRVVECDERESSLRRVLNFGHTFGHAIEENEAMSDLYHGECVALGMTYMTSGEAKERLIKILSKYSLPTEYGGDVEAALRFVVHDKKCEGASINVIFSDEIGTYRTEKISAEDFANVIRLAR